jgi:hypothetical protein
MYFFKSVMIIKNAKKSVFRTFFVDIWPQKVFPSNVKFNTEYVTLL